MSPPIRLTDQYIRNVFAPTLNVDPSHAWHWHRSNSSYFCNRCLALYYKGQSNYAGRSPCEGAQAELPFTPSKRLCCVCDRELSSYLDAYHGKDPEGANTCRHCRDAITRLGAQP